jgi:hypothetical protein
MPKCYRVLGKFVCGYDAYLQLTDDGNPVELTSLRSVNIFYQAPLGVEYDVHDPFLLLYRGFKSTHKETYQLLSDLVHVSDEI